MKQDKQQQIGSLIFFKKSIFVFNFLRKIRRNNETTPLEEEIAQDDTKLLFYNITYPSNKIHCDFCDKDITHHVRIICDICK